MPRRSRSRVILGPKKAKKTRGGDPEAPTEEEWRTMTEFGSFIVRDEDGDEHTFKKGDTATVLPHKAQVGSGLELHQYWVVKIRDIRVRGEADVWARVQWYWSGSEVQGVIKSLATASDGHACGQYERIFSDHFDYVSSSAFDAVLPVKKFNENDLEQPHIDHGTFFTRYTFEYRARVIQPKPGEGTCTCGQPYSPDDSKTLMHFCPRPSCRRAYHDRCLTKAKSKDTDSPTTRALRLLSTSPDSEEPLDLAELVPSEPPKKKRRGRPSKAAQEKGKAKHLHTVEELLEALPRDLVRVAEQPIVRGAAFVKGGVTGNVRAVVRARRMVYEALAGRGEVPEEWEDEVDVERAIVVLPGKKMLSALVCPECKSAI
ncbi:hypothetical protein Hypma_001294 [Hypsizygus marmoreus]|uniref:BAH domain-containing protein n=1 Tax=Hypsizygus marmoreus TaxID=39966 RepID=A0A369K0N9_HYPMA|nr:hypothetical protein Hypma_001294 [Hypsizygus marmoreus]